MKSLIYKGSIDLSASISSKILPLGKRLIEHLKSEERFEYLVFHTTQKEFASEFEDVMSELSSKITPQVLERLYNDGWTSEDVKKEWMSYLGKILPTRSNGYLIIRCTLNKKDPRTLALMDTFTFVSTTAPKKSGEEDVINPTPKGNGIVIPCLQSNKGLTPYSRIILLKKDSAVVLAPEDRKGEKFYFDSLSTIKDQLFDAPDDVKDAFNTLVQYFAGPSRNIIDTVAKQIAAVKEGIKQMKSNGASHLDDEEWELKLLQNIGSGKVIDDQDQYDLFNKIKQEAPKMKEISRSPNGWYAKGSVDGKLFFVRVEGFSYYIKK